MGGLMNVQWYQSPLDKLDDLQNVCEGTNQHLE